MMARDVVLGLVLGVPIGALSVPRLVQENGAATDNIMRARADAARQAFESIALDAVGDRCLWSERWMLAEQAAAPTRASEYCAAHLSRVSEIDDVSAKLLKMGRVSYAQRAMVSYFKPDAELRLKQSPGK